MANLESIAGNLGRGVLTGISKIVDPLGYVASKVDYAITGTGYSEENSPDTIHNMTYKTVYRKPEEEVSFKKGYAPRFIGNVLGGGLAFAGLAGLYVGLGPIAALTVPALFGVYSTITTAKEYAKGFFKKYEEGERKASFSDGFKYGWHSGTNSYLKLFHYMESNLNGRGVDQSAVNSSMKYSAGKMKSRSFGGFAGRVLGGITGTAVSVLSFGIVPLYKTIRDTMRARNPEAAKA